MSDTGSSILDSVRRRAFEKCIPLSATIEVTLRCNIRCAHCYNLDRAVPHARGREMPDDRIHRLLDELREEGCLYVGFTGGESLLHRSLAAFVRHATRMRMAVTVKTNGTLLTQRVAAALARAGTSQVDLSLHGGTATTHDRFTGAPGSFEKTLRGARHARRAGMRVHLAFSLGMHDAHEIEEMRRIAEDLDVPCGIDSHITARYDGGGRKDPCSLLMDRATMERVYGGALADILKEPRADLSSPPQCACARSVCGISATGEVYPCIGAPVASGNILDRPFAEVWRTSPQLNWIRGLGLDDFETCKPCPLRAWCRRSSGVVYANTGHYTGPDPFTCLEAEVLHALSEKRDPATSHGMGASLKRHSVDR